MNLEELIVDAVAALSESQQEGTTLVALSVAGVPPQAIAGVSLVEGVALIELAPNSLIEIMLEADLAVPESDGDSVTHITFIQTLCQTFTARSDLTPEVRAALGRLGRCADFRAIAEIAIAEAANYAEHAEGVDHAGSS